MKNCFKKVLAEVNSNSDSERINTLTIKIDSHSSGATNSLRVNGVSRMKIRCGGTFSGGQSYIDNPDASTAYRIDILSTPVYIDIIDNYNLISLTTWFRDSCKIIGSFKGRTAITNMQITNVESFDISNLENCISLKNLSITRLKAAFGNLSYLGKCTDILSLDFYSNNVYGDWNEFINLLISNGKSVNTDGITLYTPTITSKIAMNGFAIPYDGSATRGKLCWDNTKRYLLCGTTSQWNKVYCVGYSQSEIDTNIASGGIWQGISSDNVFNCG